MYEGPRRLFGTILRAFGVVFGFLWRLVTFGEFFCILKRFGSIFVTSPVQHQAGRRPAVLQFFTSCCTCKDNVALAWGAPKIPKVWITCPQALFISPTKVVHFDATVFTLMQSHCPLCTALEYLGAPWGQSLTVFGDLWELLLHLERS